MNVELGQRAVRALASAGLAGIVTGVLAGMGARVAMRISAVAGGPAIVGLRTENGNTVGDITLGGTLGLVIFAGLFPGVIAGILYVAVRPWLAALGRWRGLVYGLLLLATFGSIVLDARNGDFSRFGPAPLNVLLFALLFPLVGAMIAPLTDHVDHAVVARASTGGGSEIASLAASGLGFVAALFLLVLGVGATITSFSRSEGNPWIGVAFFSTLVVALALRLLPRERVEVRYASYAVLMLPVLVGGVQTASAIRLLLT